MDICLLEALCALGGGGGSASHAFVPLHFGMLSILGWGTSEPKTRATLTFHSAWPLLVSVRHAVHGKLEDPVNMVYGWPMIVFYAHVIGSSVIGP